MLLQKVTERFAKALFHQLIIDTTIIPPQRAKNKRRTLPQLPKTKRLFYAPRIDARTKQAAARGTGSGRKARQAADGVRRLTQQQRFTQDSLPQ